MAKKKKLKKINKVVNKKTKKKFKLRLNFDLPEDIKKKIYGIIMFLIAVIVSLSFFHKAGQGGEFLMKAFIYLIGKKLHNRLSGLVSWIIFVTLVPVIIPTLWRAGLNHYLSVCCMTIAFYFFLINYEQVGLKKNVSIILASVFYLLDNPQP